MIVDRCRDIEEFRKLHAECENERVATVDEILKHWNYHFCFYDDDEKLTGCIYIENDEGKPCLSGFSKRKNYKIVIDAIKWVSEFMRQDDLYSHTDFQNAKIVLMRCGFTRISDDWFIRKAF